MPLPILETGSKSYFGISWVEQVVLLLSIHTKWMNETYPKFGQNPENGINSFHSFHRIISNCISNYKGWKERLQPPFTLSPRIAKAKIKFAKANSQYAKAFQEVREGRQKTWRRIPGKLKISFQKLYNFSSDKLFVRSGRMVEGLLTTLFFWESEGWRLVKGVEGKWTFFPGVAINEPSGEISSRGTLCLNDCLLFM